MKQTKTYYVPQYLETANFYGIQCDEKQKEFRDAIWNKDIKIIFCDAKAGTGKTTISVAVASLLVKYNLYNGLVYIVAPTQERVMGYIPGSVQEKASLYFEPLYQALVTINEEPDEVLTSNTASLKNGTAYITPLTHVYLRGCNFENKVIIIDEAQNFYFDELKKVLTRMHDSCKVIVIGHKGQNDLYKNPQNSGFIRYLEWFKKEEYCKVCELTKNYRGVIASKADELEV